MRPSFLATLVVSMTLLGCASDEGIICERLSECDLVPDGLSQSECEDQAVRQVPEDRLEKCADCVGEHDCKKLVDACRNVCEPGD